MNLPVKITNTSSGLDSVVHEYALKLSGGSRAPTLPTNTSGRLKAGSPSLLLDMQDVNEYRVYRLADGTVEVRLRRSVAFSLTGVATTTSLIRYTPTSRNGTGQ